MRIENPFVITPSLRAHISRAQSISLALGIIFTGLTAIEFFLDPAQFFRSYMVGFLFIFGIALGSLACLMLQYMTGGAWGMVIRRQLEAGARTIPFVTLLFVPLLFSIPHLYDWANPHLVQTDKVLREKSGYLNPTWWIVRAAVVFALWNLWSFMLNKLSAQEEETGDVRFSRSLTRWSGLGLVMYVLSLTCAGTDWIMSMDAHWVSTIFGLILLGGQGLAIMATVVITTTLLIREEPMQTVVTKRHLHDLGKLLFMFTLFWTYVSFGQLVIIWAGNLPDEITWYINRMNGSWIYAGAALLFLQWMLPFLILLSQDIKRNAKTIRIMAIWTIVMRVVDMLWLVEPNYHREHIYIGWADITAVIGLGGLWAFVYLMELKKRALIPINAPDLERGLVYGPAH